MEPSRHKKPGREKKQRRAIEKLKTAKVPGTDKITLELIKFLNEKERLELLQMMNEHLENILTTGDLE